jgi:hypothetical protein
LATSSGNGSCPPNNQYQIYNYYCASAIVEETLPVGLVCRPVVPLHTGITCGFVEAFIDTMGVAPGNSPPVFYRCYWYTTNPPNTIAEVVEFEWSATSEYIKWYINTIGNTAPNSAYALIVASGAVLPPGFPVGIIVPLLKVTNHSPSLF